MRKVFWCCLAAGAAVCCAFWAAAYVSQNPDSPVGRYALSAGNMDGAAAPGRPFGTAETDDLIPPDPVPVDDLPPLPEPGSHMPAAVAALMAPPPILIHDEEDLNPSTGPVARAQPATSGNFDVDVESLPPATYDLHAIARRLDGFQEAAKPTSPLVMPYCTDDSAAPTMPYCTDDNPVPTMPSDGKDTSKAGSATYRECDTYAFWMGFFSGPSHVLSDPSGARWQEDAHYTQQYSGVPYTSAPTPVEQPAKADAKPLPIFLGVDETPEPSAPKSEKHDDPQDLFSHPHPLKMKLPADHASDTMEMRPGDWKPYSLDPGPF